MEDWYCSPPFPLDIALHSIPCARPKSAAVLIESSILGYPNIAGMDRNSSHLPMHSNVQKESGVIQSSDW